MPIKIHVIIIFPNLYLYKFLGVTRGNEGGRWRRKGEKEEGKKKKKKK